MFAVSKPSASEGTVYDKEIHDGVKPKLVLKIKSK